jgi:hypothetical protein
MGFPVSDVSDETRYIAFGKSEMACFDLHEPRAYLSLLPS